MSQTLDRALRILDFIGEQPRRIGEIAQYLGVHHSTALRLLHTLRENGFAYELPDHRYRLGSAIFRLGFQALEALDIRSVARPYMERLNEKTGETIHLGVLENDHVVYVEKVEARHVVRMHSRIGAIAPLHCTGVAKAILAFLPPDQRRRLIEAQDLVPYTPRTLVTVEALEADLHASVERGYALDDREHEPGIHCIAAPILMGGSEVGGAISISTPVERISYEALLGFAPALIETTQDISGQLGWSS